MLVLGLSQALAGPFSIGVQAAVVKDLPDGIAADETAGFDLGPGLVAPLRLTLVDDLVELRLTAELSAGVGWDRLTWSEGTARFYDDDHWALYSSGRFLLGPEVIIPTGDDPFVSPYFGAGVGPGWIWTFHSFTTVTEALLDTDVNDVGSAFNLDPYTRQWAAAAGSQIGVRFGRGPGLVVEVEAGYTVSHVAAAPLRKTLESYGATREPWSLNTFRLGLGVATSF